MSGRKVARKAAARGQKTTAKTTAVAQVPQPHGGALNTGGTPGNEGGTGRPPSVLRERLRGSYEQRIGILDAIADGEVIERAEVPLAAVLAHAHCPRCKGKLKANDPAGLFLVTIEGKRSASAGERLKSLDQMAKYGLGESREVSVDEVKGRLNRTVDVLTSELPADVADRVLALIEPIWSR